ncbi:MAG: type II toxin-antitoxin system VapC family toxin [Bryobacteraceae bacterium]
MTSHGPVIDCIEVHSPLHRKDHRSETLVLDETVRRVYVETTIASYLTAHRSRDLVVAAHQELTIEWWGMHRHRFALFVSEVVLTESGRGDPAAATRRLVELQGIQILELNDRARELARAFVDRRLIPEKAVEDALHVAVATVGGMDFLLTWNCRHIANAEVVDRLGAVCLEFGYRMPVLCTPEQLMGN